MKKNNFKRVQKILLAGGLAMSIAMIITTIDGAKTNTLSKVDSKEEKLVISREEKVLETNFEAPIVEENNTKTEEVIENTNTITNTQTITSNKINNKIEPAKIETPVVEEPKIEAPVVETKQEEPVKQEKTLYCLTFAIEGDARNANGDLIKDRLTYDGIKLNGSKIYYYWDGSRNAVEYMVDRDGNTYYDVSGLPRFVQNYTTLQTEGITVETNNNTTYNFYARVDKNITIKLFISE